MQNGDNAPMFIDDGVEYGEAPVGSRHRNGGAREGSGRKPNGYVKPKEVQAFDAARARNEQAKAELNELELKIKSGEYGSRAAFRQATATALASLAQTLRSVPDNLERRLGISPEIAAEVGMQIDDALNDIASEFEMMTSQNA